MSIQSRTMKKLLAGFTVAFLGALGAAAPVQAQYGWDDDDWEPPRRARTVVIEKSFVSRPPVEEVIEEPVVRRPAVERTVIIKQPIVRPVVHRTVVIERPVVQTVIRRTVVRRPLYVQRVVRWPVYPRPVQRVVRVYPRQVAFVDQGWHKRPRCYLPERHLCR